MKNECNLLVVDRNPYIRSFLKRELSAPRYTVHLAANSQQAIEWVDSGQPLDILLLDPELPDVDGMEFLQTLYAKSPDIILIVHTLPSEIEKYSGTPIIAACIEKRGSSIELLKKAISVFFS